MVSWGRDVKRGIAAAALIAAGLAMGLIGCGPDERDEAIDPPGGASFPNPLLLATGPYVDPDGVVARWVRDNPEHPLQPSIRRSIAEQPMARWLSGDTPTDRRGLDQLLTGAERAFKMPVVVVDQLPGPRCGDDRPSQFPNSQDYLRWISEIADAIAQRPVIIVLEPHSLETLDCLPPANHRARIDLLRAAVTELDGPTSSPAILLDGGPGELDATPRMAHRLRDAFIGRTDGFVVNIGGTLPTPVAQAYGASLREQLGRITARSDNYSIVIDTARNGNTAAPQGVCNPPGAQLGTISLTNDVSEAQELWITTPGVSDGDCGAAPGSQPGQFVPELAFQQIRGS